MFPNTKIVFYRFGVVFTKLIFGLSLGRVLCHVYGWIVDSIGVGLLSGERDVFGMSLGKKNSLYGSFKGAPGTQFRGFHAAAQLHCLCKASNFGRP